MLAVRKTDQSGFSILPELILLGAFGDVPAGLERSCFASAGKIECDSKMVIERSHSQTKERGHDGKCEEMIRDAAPKRVGHPPEEHARHLT